MARAGISGGMSRDVDMGQREAYVAVSGVLSARQGGFLDRTTYTTDGSGTFQLVRRYVPTWRLVVCLVAAVTLFGAILLLWLLIKREERATITISERGDRSTVTVAGMLDRRIADGIESI